MLLALESYWASRHPISIDLLHYSNFGWHFVFASLLLPWLWFGLRGTRSCLGLMFFTVCSRRYRCLLHHAMCSLSSVFVCLRYVFGGIVVRAGCTDSLLWRVRIFRFLPLSGRRAIGGLILCRRGLFLLCHNVLHLGTFRGGGGTTSVSGGTGAGRACGSSIGSSRACAAGRTGAAGRGCIIFEVFFIVGYYSISPRMKSVPIRSFTNDWSMMWIQESLRSKFKAI